jgi:hypothetical protein
MSEVEKFSNMPKNVFWDWETPNVIPTALQRENLSTFVHRFDGKDVLINTDHGDMA